MTQPTERTRLIIPAGIQSEYNFDSNLTREHKRRVKQFQCCICTLFISILLVALVMTIILSINHELSNNSTVVDNITDSNVDTPAISLFSTTFPLDDVPNRNKIFNKVTLFNDAIEEGKKKLVEKDDIEKNIASLRIHTPSYRHQRVTATNQKARELSRQGFIEEYATRHIHRDKIDRLAVEGVCPDNVICGSTEMKCNEFHKYRTLNGTCNNLKKPQEYGVAYRPFRRMLPPDYADGISKPRVSRTGELLPSARTVSLEVHRAIYRDDPKFTVLLAVWGQFLDHDITATAISQKSNGSTISCCDKNSTTSPECFPVDLDENDPFREYNLSCMEFVRSAPAPTCCLGPREQMNQVTSFIDGSVIYSVDEDLAKLLRDMENGTMKVLITSDGRHLLPISLDLNDGCNRQDDNNGQYCFMTGDARANENLHLTTMHLLWVRQHNSIAKNLSEINPHWKDEQIFQETRRIVAAQIQYVTYNEFLPILLGENVMKKYNLLPMRKGYFKKYNDSINPDVANNFATAAFRFAHSIIPGLMKLLVNDKSSPEYIHTHKMLFNPFPLYDSGELDKTLKGAMNTSIDASDTYFTNELKSHLFEKTAEQIKQPKLCGLDLVSLNVQRGRDHGLPGYTAWRKHCGLAKAENFSQLSSYLESNALHNIEAIYTNVDDIDLYTGALSEKPLKDSILGPTVTCLILDQFYRLKHGDRFWFENPQKPQAFTPDQLTELRKTSLASIICDNADDIKYVQKEVMKTFGTKNNYIDCSDLEKTNFKPWIETLDHLNIGTYENILVRKSNNKTE